MMGITEPVIGRIKVRNALGVNHSCKIAESMREKLSEPDGCIVSGVNAKLYTLIPEDGESE